ncbi:MAG: ATP-binding protein [Candidatus Odinarchaeota archaeon]
MMVEELCFRLLELKGVRIPLTLSGIRNRLVVEYSITDREVKGTVIVKRSKLQTNSSYLATFKRVAEFFRQREVEIVPLPPKRAGIKNPCRLVYARKITDEYLYSSYTEKRKTFRQGEDESEKKIDETIIDRLLDFLLDAEHAAVQVFLKPGKLRFSDKQRLKNYRSEKNKGDYNFNQKIHVLKMEDLDKKQRSGEFEISVQVLIAGEDKQQVKGLVEGVKGILRSNSLIPAVTGRTRSFQTRKPMRKLRVNGNYIREWLHTPKRALAGTSQAKDIEDVDSPTEIEKLYPSCSVEERIYIGNQVLGGRTLDRKVWFPLEEFSSHFSVWGQSGSGKSRFLYGLAVQLVKKGKILIFDLKGEYKWVFPETGDFLYFKVASTDFPVGLNIFELPDYLEEEEKEDYIQFIIYILHLAMKPYGESSAQQETIISLAVNETVRRKGDMGTFISLLDEKTVIKLGAQGQKLDASVTAVRNRMIKFLTGTMGKVFSASKTNLDAEMLLSNNIIIDLLKLDELGDVSGRRLFIETVCQMILYLCKKRKTQRSPGEIENFVIVDEVQRMVDGQQALESRSPFVNLAQTGRSAGLCLIVSGTEPTIAKSVWVNSGISMIFYNKYDASVMAQISGIERERYLRLNESLRRKRRAIASIRSVIIPVETLDFDYCRTDDELRRLMEKNPLAMECRRLYLESKKGSTSLEKEGKETFPVVVAGMTYGIRGLLRELGLEWHGESKQWKGKLTREEIKKLREKKQLVIKEIGKEKKKKTQDGEEIHYGGEEEIKVASTVQELLTELNFLCQICPRGSGECGVIETVKVDKKLFDDALKVLRDNAEAFFDYIRSSLPLMVVICKFRGFFYYIAMERKMLYWSDRNTEQRVIISPEIFAEFFIQALQRWGLKYPTVMRERISNFLKRHLSEEKRCITRKQSITINEQPRQLRAPILQVQAPTQEENIEKKAFSRIEKIVQTECPICRTGIKVPLLEEELAELAGGTKFIKKSVDHFIEGEKHLLTLYVDSQFRAKPFQSVKVTG